MTEMDFSSGCELNVLPQLFHRGEAFRVMGPSLDGKDRDSKAQLEEKDM